MTNKIILFLGIVLCLIGFSSIVYADSLADRMAGKILLQVEESGEGWYVNPDNGKRYFMGKPKDAFQLMRDLGVGISNSNLDQIPVAEDSADPDAVANEANNQDKQTKNQTEEEGQDQESTESEDLSDLTEIIKKDIGETVSVSKYDYKVNAVFEQDLITGALGSDSGSSNGKFIVIDISVTNKTSSDVSFSPDMSDFNPQGLLLTSGGNSYTTYDNMIGYIDNYLTQRTLAPGIEERGKLVYEIPSDVNEYYLETAEMGEEKYKIYKIDLTSN
jgi:hypothetical protein